MVFVLRSTDGNLLFSLHRYQGNSWLQKEHVVIILTTYEKNKRVWSEMKIQDKVVVVTGAGGGVGRELTLCLLSRGARVVGIDIDAAALEQTRLLAGEQSSMLAVYDLDISNKEAVKSNLERILARFEAVDILINNAGIIHPFLNVEETEDATIEKVFRVNFLGTLTMIRAFLPVLRRQKCSYLVNLVSSGGLSPMPRETIYGASKAAVRLLTEGLQNELRTSGVRVMGVFPGGINTNIIRNSQVPVEAGVEKLRDRFAFLLLTPQKVAEKIVHGIEHGRTRLILGIDAVVMDFLGRISPRFAPGLIYRIIDRILSPHIRAKKSVLE